MKLLIALFLLLITIVHVNFAIALIDLKQSKPELQQFPNLELAELSEKSKQIDLATGHVFIPYTLLMGQAVKLRDIPSKQSFYELRIWGRWKSEFKQSQKLSSEMKVWRNISELEVPRLQHNHLPVKDQLSGLQLWIIPLGLCKFDSEQKIHFTLPIIKQSDLFLVHKIEILNPDLSGFTLTGSDQTTNSDFVGELVSSHQKRLIQILEDWFPSLLLIQILLGVLLFRYYMVAQAYLTLLIFVLVANLWFDFPYHSEKYQKGLFLEPSMRLRELIKRGFDIPQEIDSKFYTEFETLRNRVSNRLAAGDSLASLERMLEEDSQKLGLGLLVYDGQLDFAVNVDESIRLSLKGDQSRYILEIIYNCLKESAISRDLKALPKQTIYGLNQKLSAVTSLLKGIAAYDNLFKKFVDNPNRLISIDSNVSNRFKDILWSYIPVPGGKFILIIGGRKLSQYQQQLNHKVKDYYEKELRKYGFFNSVIFIRQRYGPSYDQNSAVDSNFLKLHEYHLDSVEYSHYDKVLNKHYLYVGAALEQLHNFHLIIRISAEQIISKVLKNVREVLIYKISILLLPLLAFLISGLVSWRLSKLFKNIRCFISDGKLKSVAIEGRDQITDLTRQINSVMAEPSRRSPLIQLKLQRSMLEIRTKKLIQDPNNGGQAIHVVLHTTAEVIPACLEDHVLWTQAEDKNFFRGWLNNLDFECLIDSLKQAKQDQIDALKYCRLILLKSQLRIFQHKFAVFAECPQIIPDANFDLSDIQEFLDSWSSSESNEFSIFTNLDELDRIKLKDSIRVPRSWKEVKLRSISGYQLH